MSSNDFGPSLPPHMKRGQYSDCKDEERSAKQSSSSCRGRDNVRRERYPEDRRDRDRDRRRDTSRRRRDGNRHEDRYRDRHLHKKSEHGKQNYEHPGVGISTLNQTPTVKKNAKRSKSDRTYNTDTEESSDDHEEINQWRKYDKISDVSEHSGCESNDDILASVNPHRHPFSGRYSENLSSPQPSNTPTGCEPDVIGPALPPHLMKQQALSSVSEGVAGNKSEILNPKIQDGVQNKPQDFDDNAEADVLMGPVLPPHLQEAILHKETSSDVLIGPALPPLVKKMENVPFEVSASGSSINVDAQNNFEGHSKMSICDSSSRSQQPLLGPVLPPGFKAENESDSSDSCSEEVVGPLLPDEVMRNSKNYMIQRELERNAAALKEEMEGKVNNVGTSVKREEWMLELPPEGTVDLGLGPRSFRIRGAPEKGADRSVWTDTPADKVRKEEEAKRKVELGMSSSYNDRSTSADKDLSNRDKFMEDLVKKHSKKRSKESLLEAHQKKLKKEKRKKEESGVKQERRPFNRDIDLKTNVFDNAQKKAIFNKAQFLDSRFSRGESKYL